jgi:hypothetical protein
MIGVKIFVTLVKFMIENVGWN